MGSGKSYNTSHEAAFSPLRSTLTSGTITPQADDTLQERRCRFKREKGHLTGFNITLHMSDLLVNARLDIYKVIKRSFLTDHTFLSLLREHSCFPSVGFLQIDTCALNKLLRAPYVTYFMSCQLFFCP